jgi:hypothetical protein
VGAGVGRRVSYSIPGVSRVGDLWVLEKGELYPTVSWNIQSRVRMGAGAGLHISYGRGRVGAGVGRAVSYKIPGVSRVGYVWVPE